MSRNDIGSICSGCAGLYLYSTYDWNLFLYICVYISYFSHCQREWYVRRSVISSNCKNYHKGLRPMREPNFSLQFQYPSDVVQDQVFISGTRRSPSLWHAHFRFFFGVMTFGHPRIWKCLTVLGFRGSRDTNQPWWDCHMMTQGADTNVAVKHVWKKTAKNRKIWRNSNKYRKGPIGCIGRTVYLHTCTMESTMHWVCGRGCFVFLALWWLPSENGCKWYWPQKDSWRMRRNNAGLVCPTVTPLKLIEV